MVPTPVDRPDLGLIRTYVTFLDGKGVGRPGYVDLDRRTLKVVAVSTMPLFDVGSPGSFDENGVTPTSVVSLDDRHVLMYYVGYELGTKIRYRMLSGVAISEDGGESFRRHSRAPILERSDKELLFRCGPFVVRESDRFRMWYIAGSGWTRVDGKDLPRYSIKYLESADGLAWGSEGAPVIDVSDEDEHGFGRPWILRTGSGYDMFYSVRRKSHAAYRLGYAHSVDGVRWERKDARLGLDAGPEAYDDRAIMYAAPVRIGDTTYCFYNGNDFGREGFAVAIREEA
ncbi:MAG: hypothetical protein JWL98_428 [Xanthomonadaceae bacterium]|nr:hypothetical protein [Xanthomonadaceae bacterium]